MSDCAEEITFNFNLNLVMCQNKEPEQIENVAKGRKRKGVEHAGLIYDRLDGMAC